MNLYTKLKITVFLIGHRFYQWLSGHAGNTEIGFENHDDYPEDNTKSKNMKNSEYSTKCTMNRVDVLIDKFEKEVDALEKKFESDTSEKIDKEISKVSSIIKISNRNNKA